MFINGSWFMEHEVEPMIVTISKGQQITVPASYRRQFGLRPGSRLEVKTSGNRLVILPVSDDMELLFKQARAMKPRKTRTAEEFDEMTENELFGR